MPKADPFRDFVLDQLAGWDEVRARAMFGGVGLYQGPTFFGLISSDGRLYLKVDDASRPAYAARGMGPFRPGGGGRKRLARHSIFDVDDCPAHFHKGQNIQKRAFFAAENPAAAVNIN